MSVFEKSMINVAYRIQERMEQLCDGKNNCSSLLHSKRYDEASDVDKRAAVECEVFCTLSTSSEGW